MKTILFSLPLVFLATTPLPAQNDIPLLRPEERRAVEEQATEFNRALLPVLAHAAKSTVRIREGTRRVAYGTVIGDGRQVLTKWSEVARAHQNLFIEAAGGDVRSGRVAAVYRSEDLAVVTISEGDPLVPVEWSFEAPALGKFLAAPQPDGRPAAFGVVSVLERSLRSSDQAHLGIQAARGYQGPGVKIEDVRPDTGAAAAGIRAGEVIREVNRRPISGLLELQNALRTTSPGEVIEILAETEDGETIYQVTLGDSSELAIPHFSNPRLRQMERMGGAVSNVSSSFSRVVQTDMRPKPDQIGGPVVDLQGRVVGVTMARADRTRSFMMSAQAIMDLLEQDAIDPALALEEAEAETASRTRFARREVRGRPRTVPPAPSRQRPGGEDRTRRHLSDMQRLMDRIHGEIEALEAGR